ncbi:MAG TPA: mechanosensitive ion channel domain-containing protein [Steroidobacteraceae bacterium]|jgi:small-conductance mechanosensitive channel|nr:mechanosensitive ion channel domain-containing protein [Steroidobacteraceae bacterium]
MSERSIPAWKIAGALVLLLGCAPVAIDGAETGAASAAPSSSSHAPSPSSAAPSSSSAAAAPEAPPPMTAPRVIEVLDQAIDWYRTLGLQQQAATEPRDMLILFDNRQTANQVLSVAFEIARTDADLLSKQPAASQQSGKTSGASQSLTQLQDKFTAQGVAVQNELEDDRRQIARASAREKTALEAKVRELQGELDLINARKSLLATMATFTNRADGNGLGATSLKAQIDAMAIALPATSAPAAAAGAPVPAAGTGSTAPATSAASLTSTTGVSSSAAVRFGIWDLATNAVRLSEKIATIDSIDHRTAQLQTTFADIRRPIIDRLKALSARGDALAAQADSADSATLDSVRTQLDSLSSQFKQASSLLIPLTKEGVLLNQYRRNLGNWRDTVRSQYHNALETLGIRVGVLLALLVLVFAAAEVWRRAVMRYIQDSRRRYQFLLLRRIALWAVVVVIVGFAFASELGSVVTFAGLITAGLAVAMQSVLVSIVGYFFLIGKYGIRVGDRVQIGDVTGEVIELGLVRLYLMELGGHGLLGPTGRVVAFANSIVFQVSTGLFKQIHGVNFVWREIVVALPAGIDYSEAKERIAAAVAVALKDYRDDFLRQSKEIQRASASNTGGDAQPRVQLGFSASGVEAHIRYPVHLENSGEIDERVSREVMRAINELTAAAKSA